LIRGSSIPWLSVQHDDSCGPISAHTGVWKSSVIDPGLLLPTAASHQVRRGGDTDDGPGWHHGPSSPSSRPSPKSPPIPRPDAAPLCQPLRSTRAWLVWNHPAAPCRANCLLSRKPRSQNGTKYRDTRSPSQAHRCSEWHRQVDLYPSIHMHIIVIHSRSLSRPLILRQKPCRHCRKADVERAYPVLGNGLSHPLTDSNS